MEQKADRELKKLCRQKVTWEIVIQCTLVFALAVVIYSLAVADLGKLVLLGMGMCVYVVAWCVIRKIVKNGHLMLLLAIALPCTALFAGSSATERGMSVLITAIISFCSYNMWKTRTKENDKELVSVYAVAAFVVEYMLIAQHGKNVITFFILICAVVFVTGQIFHNNVVHIMQIVKDSEADPGFHAKRLRKMQFKLIMAAVIVMLLLVVVICNTAFDNVIGHAVMAVLYPVGYAIVGFMELFKVNSNELITETETVTMPTGEGTGAAGGAPPTQEPTTVPDLNYGQNDDHTLQMMAMMSGVILIIAAVIVLIAVIAGLVVKYRKTRVVGTDEIEYIGHEEAKQAVAEWEQESEQTNGMNDSFRKHYKKNVLKGYKEKKSENGRRGKVVPSASTFPSKLTEEGITADIEKAEGITRVYEKARYSNVQITEEELKKGKNDMKK